MNAITAAQSCSPPSVSNRDQAQRLRVAYLMSRFPKITETFILREMIELERQGQDVEVFPLRRERTRLVQPDAESYVARAHFTPVVSWAIVWANLVSLCRQPRRYVSTLVTLIRANLGCLRFLAGAVLYFPKAVYLARRMRALEIAHIHAHFASHPAAIAFAIGRLSGIPYSFVAHGSDLHRDQHMLLEKTREAAFVAAISQYNRQMILDVCGREFEDKVQVVHCGIDPSRFRPRQEETPYASGRGPFRVACIGTLHEVKGQTFLIEACRILADRGIDVVCHLLGDGEDREALQQQANAAQLGERVVFHGSCTSDTVVEQLALADAVVCPSVPSRDGRREGIPVVLMEAMACGVPCVASRLSGIPELVEDQVTGILTAPGDAAAIADALERLANCRATRVQFARESVRKVDEEFSLPQTTARLAELLRATARNGGTA